MDTCWDVLGFGAVAVDDLVEVDHHPAPDAKTPVRARRREGGGLAGTALVAAARLGARAAYCGVLGDDELSRFILDGLHSEGVDCSPTLRRSEARPRHSIIIVDRSDGGRSILSSSEGWQEFPPENINDELIARCRVIFVDHTVARSGAQAAALAQKQGIPVVGDIERVDVEGLADLLAHIDHLIVSRATGEQLSGQNEPLAILGALREGGRRCCVLTAGAHGCWYLEKGAAMRHVPAFAVRVVDTTGCGDVFHGAYAACLARGDSIDTAVVTASAAAALKATQPGGRSGIPTGDEVQRFLVEHAAATRSATVS